MKKNVKKYGLMIIAAMLLVAMAFAGAASAVSVDIGSAEEWNAFAYSVNNNDLTNQTTDVNITNSFSFEGAAPIILGIGSGYPYRGNISGNGNTISNFVIDTPGANCIGLIGYYSGSKIGNLTISNFSVSSSANVGGLVGYAISYPGTTVIENVHAEFGNVIGIPSGSYSYDVGGLVGGAYEANFINCSTESCVIASSGNKMVGGLVGYASSASFDSCKVVNCSISGRSEVGGVVGYPYFASCSPFMNGSSVTNCIVSAGSSRVGGLVGFTYDATAHGITGCVVEDCVIVSTVTANVGGLVGFSSLESVFNAGNWVNESAVRGNENWDDDYVGDDYVGEVVGCDNGIKKDIAAYPPANVSSDGSIWLNNDGNVDYYPKIYIAKSADSSKQGPEKSEWFNNGSFGEPTGSNAKIVTRLSGYGVNGQYEALGYVYASPELYGINITNTTGTYPLSSALTTVCGDYGTGNGTAVLTFDSESKPVLTLTNFKASNMTGNVPIINASVADLTIKLVGESSLAGSYADTIEGLLYSFGNLTIKGNAASSKLLVNNTRSDSIAVNSISVMKDLTIDNAKVTAIANNYGDGDVYGLASGNVTITGSKTIVDANVISANGGAYSIFAEDDIEIDSSAKVTAKSQAYYYTHALHSRNGNLFIGQNTIVDANSNSASGYSCSIRAGNDLKIDSAKKVNATAETHGSGYKEARGLYVNGGAITITDSPDVTATAIVLNNYDYGNACSIMTMEMPALGYGNAVAKHDIVISNSKVTAKAEGGDTAYALRSPYGNITITGDKTVIDAAATCTDPVSTNSVIAICALQNLTITSAEKIRAIGTNSSFGYNATGYSSLNINKLADYKFSNASVDGDEPTLYATFVNSSNWHVAENHGYIVSNYTAVLIEKKSTTPSSTGSSSSKQTGYTVILQDTVDISDTADAVDTSANMYTVNFTMNGHGIQVMNQSVSFGNTAEEPSPVPTANGYTFTGWYADKGLVSKYAFSTPVTDDIELYAGWTAKPSQTSATSKSPAPFLGILAGLGVAALVLARMRR